MREMLVPLGLALLVAAGASAQEPVVPLSVGTEAPDFEIPGATQSGVLDEPIKLSDYRGQTVVLAFFFKARTGG
jgi:peroxiredoxin Q/BCP